MKKFRYIFLCFLFVVIVFNEKVFYDTKKHLLSNISQAIISVKVSEQKFKIEDNKLSINIRFPSVHYEDDKNVERHINSYLRKEINYYVNLKRQQNKVSKEKNPKNINITYHIPFKNKEILNIVINKEIIENNKINLYKESYVFDLRTGQRIYLNHFLNNEEKIFTKLENHIKENLVKKNLDLDLNVIKINKNTSYEISDGGININFNPYKESDKKDFYEFKILFEVLQNNVKSIQSSKIEANIDTQTITKNTEFLNSIINIPIIIIENKELQKQVNEIITNDIMNFYKSAEAESEKFFNGNDKFIANADYIVKKNSDGMISIVINYYKFGGGAKGDFNNFSYNISTSQNKILEFKDLFVKNSNYTQIIENEIKEKIKKLQDSEIYEFKGLNKNQKFYIEDDNLVVYFDLYEIAPYPAGIVEFKINKSKINEVLKDEYKEFSNKNK